MEIKHRIELVKLLPENSVVAELGVAEGNFSNDLLEAGVGILYSVDNWGHIPHVTGDGNFPQDFHDANYKAATEKLSKFGYRSLIFKGLTVGVASRIPDNFLDMVYLDAAHYYDGVISDLVSWYPKVKPGGIISGHDYLNVEDYGVNKAVNDFVKNILNKDIEIITIPENNIKDASFYFIKP